MISLKDLIVTTLPFIFTSVNGNTHGTTKSVSIIYTRILSLTSYRMKET